MSELIDKMNWRFRLLRWRMKTMFVGITVVCVAIGLITQPNEQQKRAVAALRAIDGVTVYYDYETMYFVYDVENDDGSSEFVGGIWKPVFPSSRPESMPPGPTWLRDLIGIDYFANVSGVFCFGARLGDDDFRRLASFEKLELLTLAHSDGMTCVDLEHLAKCTSLVELTLSGNRLNTIPPAIGQIENLTVLDLGFNNFTVVPPGITELTNLKELSLENNLRITKLPTETGKLTELTHMNLRGTSITDADLKHLKLLKKLKKLYIHDTKVTKEGVANLQQSLPQCTIQSDFIYPEGQKGAF